MIITHCGHPLLWRRTVDDGDNLAAKDGKSGQPEAQIEPTTKPNLSVKSSPPKESQTHLPKKTQKTLHSETTRLMIILMPSQRPALLWVMT